MEFDDVRMLHSLQHLHLVVHHLLVALDILLEYDLDGDFPLWAVRLPHYAVCTRTECLSEPVFGPVQGLEDVN